MVTDAMTTNDAFLKKIINNFCDFLTSCLEKRLKNERFTEFKNKIDELKGIDTALFILHITETMVPFKTNVSQYVVKMLAEHELNADVLSADEKIRLGRYISCFIEIVSQ